MSPMPSRVQTFPHKIRWEHGQEWMHPCHIFLCREWKAGSPGEVKGLTGWVSCPRNTARDRKKKSAHPGDAGGAFDAHSLDMCPQGCGQLPLRSIWSNQPYQTTSAWSKSYSSGNSNSNFHKFSAKSNMGAALSNRSRVRPKTSAVEPPSGFRLFSKIHW